ncbi:MAG: hypothetical protein ACI4CT_08740 [Lachnospiraceae bacterium]
MKKVYIKPNMEQMQYSVEDLLTSGSTLVQITESQDNPNNSGIVETTGYSALYSSFFTYEG